MTNPTVICKSTNHVSGETWDIEPGSSITVTWDHEFEHFPGDHRGPAMEYMAACPDSRYSRMRDEREKTDESRWVRWGR